MLGWVAVSYPLSPTKLELFKWHKSVGLLILAWVLLRLAWRVTHRGPGLPAAMGRHERWTAHLAHALLYALMIAMPISGWIINSASDFPLKWFGLLRVPPGQVGELGCCARRQSAAASGMGEARPEWVDYWRRWPR